MREHMMVPWAALLLVGSSAAAPSISFPINSQVPPVARIGQPFSFVFSPSTFSSPLPMSYALASSPPWLSIDSDARRIYGTPVAADVPPGAVVGVSVVLVATDPSGSAVLDTTLVVSRSPAPSVDVPLASQVPSLGLFSAPDTILAHPDTSFAFSFAPDTFSSPATSELNYYAVTAENTPLPAWISFDPAALAFAGQTPTFESLVEPPQTFGFQLVASDVVGFSATALRFDMAVGSHDVTVDRTVIAINATSGSSFSYSLLQDGIHIDSTTASPGDLAITSTPGMPSWVSVDRNSGELHGLPPPSAGSTSFFIQLQDGFSDFLNLTVSIYIAGESNQTSDLFNGLLPDINATAGQSFSLDLGPYLSNPQHVGLSLSTDPSVPWIQLVTGGTTVSGHVPKNFEGSRVGVAVEARSKTSRSSASESLVVYVQAAARSTTSTATSQGPTGSSSPKGTPAAPGLPSAAKFNPIVLAVLIPVLLAAVMAVFLMFLWYRRRRARQDSRISRPHISGPLPNTFVKATADDIKRDFDFGYSDEPRVREKEHRAAVKRSPTRAMPASPSLFKPWSPTDRAGAASRASWWASAALGSLKPEKKAARSRSRSYLSDTSLFDDGSDGLDSGHSLVPSRGHSRASLRNVPKLDVPAVENAASIQHTPQVAYLGFGSSPRPGGSPTGSQSRSVTPSSTEAASLHPDQGRARLGLLSVPGRILWPAWSRLRDDVSRKTERTTKFMQQVKEQASQLSLTTVDTFAYKKMAGLRKAKTLEPPWQPGESPMTHVLLPAPATPLPAFRNPSSAIRPVSRRKPDANRWFGSNLGARRVRTSRSAPSIMPAGQSRGSSPLQGGAVISPGRPWLDRSRRDCLGISYEDLVGESPFHATRTEKTWSTLASVDAGLEEEEEEEGGGDGGEGGGNVPNWTLVDESPILKDRLLLTTALREQDVARSDEAVGSGRGTP